ncbi:MAG TPA: hypothetical protein VGW36_04950 [Pyrinomonadaceae bacterium]|nr:hypothetical protein [Pyrinomonadaceae bacterium]
MKRIQSILSAVVVTLVLSSNALAGDIHGIAKSGPCSGDIHGIYNALLNALSVIV